MTIAWILVSCLSSKCLLIRTPTDEWTSSLQCKLLPQLPNKYFSKNSWAFSRATTADTRLNALVPGARQIQVMVPEWNQWLRHSTCSFLPTVLQEQASQLVKGIPQYCGFLCVTLVFSFSTGFFFFPSPPILKLFSHNFSFLAVIQFSFFPAWALCILSCGIC